MIWPFPTKGTTPGQLLVFIGFVAFVLLLVGGFLTYLSFGQPQEKQQLAMQARLWGTKLILGSFVIGALTALGKRFLD